MKITVDNLTHNSSLTSAVLTELWESHHREFIQKVVEAAEFIKTMQPGDRKEFRIPEIVITLEV